MNKRVLLQLGVIVITVSLSYSCSKKSTTEPENGLPDCIIVQPSDGATLTLGDTLEIQVNANDDDGRVVHVKFFIDDQLRHTDLESPFGFLWDTSDETYGEHEIRAEVVDNKNAYGKSSPICITLLYEYCMPEHVMDDGWETASLENVDIDSAFYERMINGLYDHAGHLVHGIVVVRHGLLVFEHYFDGLTHPTWGETPVSFDRNRLHVLSSVTKSFTSTLLGIAIDREFISSVDAKVFDFYPELAELNTGKKQDITLRHLVTMSSGLAWDESSLPLTDPNNDLTRFINIALNTDEDLAGFILGKDMVSDPGAIFNYGGGNFNLIGDIIRRASGYRLDEFANEYLFDPLGIDVSWWWLLRPDFVYASGDLALRPRDIAKFGQLFLQNGNWEGEQIVSEDWVTLSATPCFLFPPPSWPISYGFIGYSFGWWPNNVYYGQGAFTSSGWGGQQINILPEYDMVVVFLGGSYWADPLFTPHEMMMLYVLPSIQ